MNKLRLVIFLLMFSQVIFSQKKKYYEKLINDSSSIYSISSKRPFKYGYPYGKEECEKLFTFFNSDFQIRNGDVVADIGGASGWMDALLSIYLDSVTFYVQDIDIRYSSQSDLDKAVNYFSQHREKTQTNTFIFVLGEAKKTNIPDKIFDKIIINNAFHEFTYQTEIIEDLISKLKPDGIILIREDFSNKYTKYKHSDCGYTAYKAKDVIGMFEFYDFSLVGASEPENSFSNCLKFSFSDKQTPFSFNNPKLLFYTEKLDQLNKKSIAKDSVKTNEILIELKKGINELHNSYVTIESYLYRLGNFYIRNKKYKEALNIFKCVLELYPNSYSINDDIAFCYENLKQEEQALFYYKKALIADPKDDYAKNAIKNIEEMKNKKNN